VKMGDTSYSYKRLGPLGMLLGFMADAVQIYGEVDMGTWEKALSLLLYPFLRNVTNRSWMSGLAEFLDIVAAAGSKGEQAAQAATRFGQHFLGSWVPATWATFEKALDPALRQGKEWLDGVYARVPGWSKAVPIRRNRFGEPRLLGWGFSSEWLDALVTAFNPYQLSRVQPSALEDELFRQRIRLQMPSALLALREPEDGRSVQDALDNPFSDTQPLRLTDRQYERFLLYTAANTRELATLGLDYDPQALTRLTREVGLLLHARPPRETLSLKEALEWAISTPHYQSEGNGPGEGKDLLIKTIVSKYLATGKAQYLESDDPLRARYHNASLLRELERTPPARRPQVEQARRRQYEREEATLQARRAQRGLVIGQ
jgi:hypothetical protein